MRCALLSWMQLLLLLQLLLLERLVRRLCVLGPLLLRPRQNATREVVGMLRRLLLWVISRRCAGCTSMGDWNIRGLLDAL